MADEEPRKVDKDAPLSVDTIYQLINSSIQSGKPLWLPGANMLGADLSEAYYDTQTKWPEGFDPEAAGAVQDEDMDGDFEGVWTT